MARQLKTTYARIGIAVIAVAAVAILASAAWAAIPDASGTIDACADRDGRLRVIDTESGKTCKSSETRLSWLSAAPPPPEPPPTEPPPPTEAQLPDAFVAVRKSGFAVEPTGAVTEVAKLDLPAGKYVVTAKAQVASRGTANDAPARVFCSLEPGAPANDFAGLLLAPVGHPGEAQVMTLLVNKELSEAGSVRLACSASDNVMGAGISEVVIRAVEVGSITTTDVGVPPLP